MDVTAKGPCPFVFWRYDDSLSSNSRESGQQRGNKKGSHASGFSRFAKNGRMVDAKDINYWSELSLRSWNRLPNLVLWLWRALDLFGNKIFPSSIFLSCGLLSLLRRSKALLHPEYITTTLYIVETRQGIVPVKSDNSCTTPVADLERRSPSISPLTGDST